MGTTGQRASEVQDAMDVVDQLSIATNLLVVCDIEGSLHHDAAMTERPLQVLSKLAALPRTDVTIIVRRYSAFFRDSRVLSHRVTVIETPDLASVRELRPGRFPLALCKVSAVDDLFTKNFPSLIFFAGDDEANECVFAAVGIDVIGEVEETCESTLLRDPLELLALLGRIHKGRSSSLVKDSCDDGRGRE